MRSSGVGVFWACAVLEQPARPSLVPTLRGRPGPHPAGPGRSRLRAARGDIQGDLGILEGEHGAAVSAVQHSGSSAIHALNRAEGTSKLLPRPCAWCAGADCWPPLCPAAVFLTVMSLLLTLHPQFLLTISPVFPLTTPLFPLDSGAFPLAPAVTIPSSWSPGGYCLLCAFALCVNGGALAGWPQLPGGTPQGPTERRSTWPGARATAGPLDGTAQKYPFCPLPGLGTCEGRA